MKAKLEFDQPIMVKQITSGTITTSEADLFTVTDGTYFAKSQLTIYYDITTAVQVKLRYYFSHDGGTTWYPIAIKDLVTNIGYLKDTPSIIDPNTSYSYSSGKFRLIEDIPVSGHMGFKVTAQTASSTATINKVTAFLRDN